jgi:membrane associated rhomboid family serine protease
MLIFLWFAYLWWASSIWSAQTAVLGCCTGLLFVVLVERSLERSFQRKRSF